MNSEAMNLPEIKLELLINFSRYKLVEPADHFWGIRLSNGSWSGIIGMAERKVGVCISYGSYSCKFIISGKRRFLIAINVAD